MNVLIVIDMQEASFSPASQYDAVGVIHRINHLSAQTRNNNGKVIFVQHDGTNEEGLQPFTPGWQVLSSLTKSSSDLFVRKTINDSFYNSGLHQTLTDLNVDKIIISGWATDFCVDTTLRTAVSLGYSIIAASDCHTLDNRPHLSAKKIITHHNWVWQNMLTPRTSIEVVPHDRVYPFRSAGPD